MEKLIIVGIGHMAEEVMFFVNKYKLFDIQGFAVDRQYLCSDFKGYPVYPIEELEQYADKGTVKLFVAILWYKNLNKYKRLKFEYLKEKGFHFANLISPLSSISTTSVGEGNWIHDFAVIGYNARIGDNNVFLSHIIVAHNASIGNHNVLTGRTIISGTVNVGDQNYFGVSSSVFNRIVIGNMCIIGGGSVVKKNLSDYSIVASPDSIIKKGSKKLNEFIISTKGLEVLTKL